MQRPVVALWLVGPSFGLLLSACPPQLAPPDSPSSGTRTACTPGVSFCDDNVVRICGDSGYVSDKVICADSQTCVLGACEDNIVCEPDAFLCVRNELVRCNSEGTALSSRMDCDQDFCVNGACVPVGNTCPSGESVCVGNSAALCLADGTGYSEGPTACGSSAVCVEGACLAKVCEPGASSCEGDLARTCDMWGTGFTVQRICSGELSCVRGRCQALVCDPGSKNCQDNHLLVCSDDGTVLVEDRDCGIDKVCSDGRCVSGRVDAGVPDRAGRDATAPDLARWDTTSQDLRQPDAAIPAAARPDLAQPDGARPDTTLPDQARPDLARPDLGGPDTAPPECDPIDDEYEPDDLRSQASTVSNSTTIQDLVACDQYDWFVVDVPAGRALRVSIQFTHTEADLDLAVYRNSDAAMFDESATSSDTETVEMWNAPATAYIRVQNYSYPSKVGHYTLTTSLVDPPVCGDGTVNGTERCDINIASGSSGACPTSCTDSGCNHYTLTASGTCDARCVSSPITICSSSDSCCPTGCTASNDQQCADLGYTACASDSQCPADRYCDLQRPAPVCKLGCRLSSPSGCDGTHSCASDHRCVLTNVVPHQRCAPCSTTSLCASGYDCDLLTQLCSPTCSLFNDTCATTVGEGSQCNLVVCIIGPCVCLQDDCP
ncbi:MAG: hypothetical protein ABIJ09_03930 [Pseudomonadota bacterium]